MIAFGALVGISSGPIFALAGQGLRPEERALAMGNLDDNIQLHDLSPTSTTSSGPSTTSRTSSGAWC